jgi:hypothetical protein
VVSSTGYHLDEFIVPIGEPWRTEEETDFEPASTKGMDAGGEGQDVEDEGEGEEKEERMVGVKDDFRGDRTLARSVAFMYEALVSKEVAQAVAEGDVGRVYEGIKVGSDPAKILNTDRNTGDANNICGVLTFQVHQLCP